jgi:hypothetical protein
MTIRGKSFKAGLVAGAGILLIPLFGARPAAAATPTVATCGKAIEGEIVKMQTAIMKALEVCLDGYHADLVKPESPQFTKASAKCELGLGKAIGLGNNSTMAKEKAKLDSFITPVPKSCDDVGLLLLGHLPQGTFGDVWSRAISLAALNTAYNEEAAANQDMVDGLGNLGGLYGSPAGGCPDCKTLTVPPCIEHACAYLSGSGTGFNIVSESGINIPLSGGLQPLPGVSTFTLCNYKGPGGTSVNPANDYIVLGSTSKGIKPASIPGVGFACVTGIGAEGYINCGGTDPGINYNACQDSNVTALAGTTTQAGAGGACQGALGSGAVCRIPTHDDEVNTGVNGGACINLHKQPAASGVAFINNTSTINVVQTSPDQLGLDGKPCTADDTNAPTEPGTNGLTTGTADVNVLNLGVPPGSGSIANGPVNGHTFDCGNIQTSNLTGGAIAGAFPGVANLAATSTVLGDQAVNFIIACE